MLFRRFGTRTRIYYMHWTRTNFRAETGPPDPKWFEDLVARCPSLSWGGEVQSYGGLGLSDLSELTPDYLIARTRDQISRTKAQR